MVSLIIIVGGIIWLMLGAFVAGYQHHYYEKSYKTDRKAGLIFILMYIVIGALFVPRIIKKMY